MSRKATLTAAVAALAGVASLGAQNQGNVLTAPGVDSLTLGGSIRARLETRDPVPPVNKAQSASTQLLRARAYLDAQITEDVGAFVQFQESIFGTGTASVSTLDQAYGSLHNLFEGLFDLYVGRMDLEYGNGRMVSPLEWDNVGRAWDGVKAVRRGQNYQFDLFATQPVAFPHAGAFSGVSPSGSDDFSGGYLQLDWEDVDLDLYVFKRRLAGRDFDDWTFGGLVEGNPAPWEWDVEAAYQTGEHGTVGTTTLDAAGYALAAHGAYWFEGGASVGVSFELATGRDGTDDAFVPLFNDAHNYQGHADLVTWSNLQDVVLHGMVPLSDGWGVHGDLHWLTKHESADSVRFGSGALGARSTGSDDIGTEIDVYLSGKVADVVDTWLGVSQFFAGDAVRNGDDQTWAYVMAGFGF